MAAGLLLGEEEGRRPHHHLLGAGAAACWGAGASGVGVYRQACSGILLAVGFVGRDRRLWNSMVQGTQRFRQVRAASCVIPYVLCGGLYCLWCRCVLRGSLSALIYPGE